VVGDWNGDGKTQVGVFNAGVWFRDINGNRTWDSADQASAAFFGWDGATPMPGDWNGILTYCRHKGSRSGACLRGNS
jgi:hypothetical protein